jgi:hypothetical protein
MKTIILLAFIFIANLTFSQEKNCGTSNIQLKTYNFAKLNLEKISEFINDKNSLIEVSVEMHYKKINQVKYKLILPDDNYSGKIKSEIEVWSELKKFVFKTVKIEIKKCPNFNYEKVTFRVPVSLENIEKAITEVNKILLQQEKMKTETEN